MKNFRNLFLSSILLASCAATHQITPSPKIVHQNKPAPGTPKAPGRQPVAEDAIPSLPEVPREFRGAWVATVANINWPSKNNLTTAEQKAEAIALLDLLKENNFNAVIFQVRPASDALYKSNLEPWSSYLNGETGKKPNPYYDPLEFWITEAHKRGLEFHAWLNPFRAYHTTGGPIGEESMVQRMSQDVVRLKNGTWWLDPASNAVQDHVSEIVKDLVARYDVDGIHFDDYFYPYRDYNGGKDFPDDKTWGIYKNSGGVLSRADWRRGNVNKFVKRIYDEIKSQKNYVKFGISPFGIWKPGYPGDVSGSSQYDELFADAKLWLNQGWVDYLSPQLYWPLASQKQSFTSLLRWWKSENTLGRHLWPGLNTVEVKTANRPEEILAEINADRNILPQDRGVIHWSIAGLSKSAAMQQALKSGAYKSAALPPATPWLDAALPAAPVLSVVRSGETARIDFSNTQDGSLQKVVYLQYGNQWETRILGTDTSIRVPLKMAGRTLTAVGAKAVGRNGAMSAYGKATME